MVSLLPSAKCVNSKRKTKSAVKWLPFLLPRVMGGNGMGEHRKPSLAFLLPDHLLNLMG